jgi:outer membrane assembly lipoprotein YfiO
LTAKAADYESRGKFKAAARVYKKIARLATIDMNQATAYLRQGDCEYTAGRERRTVDAYKKAIEYTAYVPINRVVDRLRELAEAFAAGKASLFHVGDPDTAIEIYEVVQRYAPAGRNAAADSLRLAQLQAETDRTEEAIVTCRELLRRHEGSREEPEARFLLAGLYLKSAESGDGDGYQTRQAQAELEELVALFPEHSSASESQRLLQSIRRKQAATTLELGRFYTSKSHLRLPAARRYLWDVVSLYGDTPAAGEARNLLLAMGEDPTSLPPVALPEPAAPAPPPERSSAAAPPPPTESQPAMLPPQRTDGGSGRESVRQREAVSKWLLPLEDAKTGEALREQH